MWTPQTLVGLRQICPTRFRVECDHSLAQQTTWRPPFDAFLWRYMRSVWLLRLCFWLTRICTTTLRILTQPAAQKPGCHLAGTLSFIILFASGGYSSIMSAHISRWQGGYFEMEAEEMVLRPCRRRWDGDETGRSGHAVVPWHPVPPNGKTHVITPGCVCVCVCLFQHS